MDFHGYVNFDVLRKYVHSAEVDANLLVALSGMVRKIRMQTTTHKQPIQ